MKNSSPWNFDAPQYDKRSSRFVNAGDNHGSGKPQPIGHAENPKQHVPCLPFGKKNMGNNEKA